MDFSQDYIEPEKKLLGVWVKPSEKDDVEFRVRPYSRMSYYTAIGAELDVKKIEIEEIKDKHEKEAAYKKFMSKKLVEVFLLDWKNVTMKGEQVPFSVDKATDLILGSEKFMQMVNTAIERVSTTVEERDEELEKN